MMEKLEKDMSSHCLKKMKLDKIYEITTFKHWVLKSLQPSAWRALSKAKLQGWGEDPLQWSWVQEIIIRDQEVWDAGISGAEQHRGGS